MDSLATKLRIQASTANYTYSSDVKVPNDWYSVSMHQFRKHGGSGLIKIYGSLMNVLRVLYPDTKWITYRFTRPHNVPVGTAFFSKTQHLLLQYLQMVSNST